jgi:hypothetical protein
MSGFLAEDLGMQHCLRRCLYSNHPQERASAIYAIDKVCARSVIFARSILPPIAVRAFFFRMKRDELNPSSTKELNIYYLCYSSKGVDSNDLLYSRDENETHSTIKKYETRS